MGNTTKHACHQAIDEYRHNREFRSEWVQLGFAVAGGCIGSALILISYVMARIF